MSGYRWKSEPLYFRASSSYLHTVARIRWGHAVIVDHSAQERAEPTFGELSFRCPVNERTVSTGIYTDAASLMRLQLIDIRVRCPHCGDVHTIRVADTFVSQTIIGRYRPNLSLVSSR